MSQKFESIYSKDKNIPLILKLDVSGNPIKWVHWKDAVTSHFNGKTVWSLGDPIRLHGGISGKTGEPSFFDLPPIIASSDQLAMKNPNKAPTLTNKALFRRDGHLCMYCGHEYSEAKLTRDHVTPTSRGGLDKWTNVVASCRGCNHLKADRTPEEAHMPLLAVPFTPSKSAHLILQNRRIIGDQMEYLKARILPEEHKRLHKYLS